MAFSSNVQSPLPLGLPPHQADRKRGSSLSRDHARTSLRKQDNAAFRSNWIAPFADQADFIHLVFIKEDRDAVNDLEIVVLLRIISGDGIGVKCHRTNSTKNSDPRT